MTSSSSSTSSIHYKKCVDLWLSHNDPRRIGHRSMTISNKLVLDYFGGSRPKNITTNLVRKVIVCLHELVIMQTALAYDLCSSRLWPIKWSCDALKWRGGHISIFACVSRQFVNLRLCVMSICQCKPTANRWGPHIDQTIKFNYAS